MARRLLTISIPLAVLVLSACGSTTVVTQSPSNAAHTGTAGTGTTATGSSTPAATSTPTSTTATQTNTRKRTTTTATGGVPACVASMLKLGYVGGQGATGHGELAFSLTNTSSQSCHTYGYPGVALLSASGSPVIADVGRTSHDFFGPAPASALTIAPGGLVSFRLATTHVPAGNATCGTAAQIQVIPPDDTHTLLMTIPNGGAYECGVATVTPLQPDGTALR